MMAYRAKKVNGRWRIQTLRQLGWRNIPGFYESRAHALDNIDDWEELDRCDDDRALQAMGCPNASEA